MNTFEVNDMTCGHCAGTIRAALSAIDSEAEVSIDVSARRVEVDSAYLTTAQLQAAIEQAGYTPVAVQRSGSAAAPRKGGCG